MLYQLSYAHHMEDNRNVTQVLGWLQPAAASERRVYMGLLVRRWHHELLNYGNRKRSLIQHQIVEL
jgi:hypothetical protein